MDSPDFSEGKHFLPINSPGVEAAYCDRNVSAQGRGPVSRIKGCLTQRVQYSLWLVLLYQLSFLTTVILLMQFTAKPGHHDSLVFKVREYDFSGYQCAPLGAPPEVARRRGCELDTFALHWYPRERLEDPDTRELMRNFTDMGWPRYYDREAKKKIDVFDPAESQAWVTKKEHYWHCGYTTILSHLWITKGFDPPVTYAHTVHCVTMLLGLIEKNPPPDLYEVAANIKTPPDPEHWPLIKPPYPCAEEGIFCH
ncbi:hypothetical protein MCOR25_007659 [Pyricularia grisea]|nr:hypothetical protein MCOR25_007659 [Pyricularia grisea]